MADFSSKTVEFNRKWNGFFKMLKEKNYLIYIAQKLKIKKTFAHMKKLRVLGSGRLSLQEIIKEVFEATGK